MLDEMTQSVVLLSAGLDSAVLTASEARTSLVQPVYVSAGLAWEGDEQRARIELRQPLDEAAHSRTTDLPSGVTKKRCQSLPSVRTSSVQ